MGLVVMWFCVPGGLKINQKAIRIQKKGELSCRVRFLFEVRSMKLCCLLPCANKKEKKKLNLPKNIITTRYMCKKNPFSCVIL